MMKLSSTGKLNGRKARAIYWPGEDTHQLTAKAGECTLVCECSFHGEYDSMWIVVLDAKGNETARYNAKYLESIMWETEEAT
jgi:hypothetical protein